MLRVSLSIPYDEGVYLDKPWMVVRWNADHLCVHAEFKAFANSAEFRAGCQTILAAIKERNAASLISDNRRLEGVTGEDQLWLRDTWFPLAIDSGLTRIATVLAPRGLGRLASEQIIRRPGHDQLTIRTFDSLPEALSWMAPGSS
jgi:hypothetical protein